MDDVDITQSQSAFNVFLFVYPFSLFVVLNGFVQEVEEKRRVS